MSSTQFQTLFGTAPTTVVRTKRYLAILCGLLAIVVLSGNARQFWLNRVQKVQAHLARAAPERPSVFQFQTALPAWAASLDDEQKFAEGVKQVSDTASDEDLAVFLYLAQKAGSDFLRAQGTLYAAEIILRQRSDRPWAEELYRYFLAHFPSQPGADKAKYNLGMLDLEKDQLSEGIYLLTSVTVDHPESPFASSASLMAQRAALALSLRELQANYRFSGWIRSVLPLDTFTLVSYLLMVLVMMANLSFHFIEGPQKHKRVTTWLNILAILLLSVVSQAVNRRVEQTNAPKLLDNKSADIGFLPPAK